MIREIYINNYKSFRDFRLPLNKDLNIIVGDNEAGKSTILEAVNLALTFRLSGRQIPYELSSYLFNIDTKIEYLDDLREGKNPELPQITIELYLDDLPEFAQLRGHNNSKREDSRGIRVEISFDDDYKEEYEALISNQSEVKTIPIEYYRASWFSFADIGITLRSLPLGVSFIDATIIRLQTGTDYYMQKAINDSLGSKDKAELAVAYRQLKEIFADEPSIEMINRRLAQHTSIISERKLKISIDLSQRANWESGLIPYLDELPFQFIGRGEQTTTKTLLALERRAEKSQIILLEEPENHLSFSSMNKLVRKISESMIDKQIILTTHSPYVLNKLGLDKLILLTKSKSTTLSNLRKDTYDYFKKLPGYDTLRLILAKRAILVEGPSDELIIQRAYMDSHEGHLPVDDGIDVISVMSLAFKRFLDIAKELEIDVAVITDNDGDYQVKVTEKYSDYQDIPSIKIFADNDNEHRNLEEQLLKVNSLEDMNRVLGTSFDGIELLLQYMLNH